MSRFARLLQTGGMPLALEITPPREPSSKILLRRARMLGERPVAVNVIQRPGRVSSLDAVVALGESGIEAVWHLTSRGRRSAEIDAEIAAAARSDVRLVLCVRGDQGADDAVEGPRIRDVIARVRRELPNALVGATLNHHASSARVLKNLLAKLRAGAEVVQTQPVFDLESLRPLAEEVKSRHPRTRIVAMLMPLVALAPAQRLQKRLSLPIPELLLERLRRADEAGAWEVHRENLAELAASPLVDGIALMTPEMDPSADFVAGVAGLLDGRIGVGL